MSEVKSKNVKKKLLIGAILVLLAAGAVGWFAWYKFFRELDERPFANEIERFKYGSVGGEATAGLPYWIWVVLPRVFPDLMPGPGGYKSFGVVWEEGRELPVGFTKKTVGFPRVGNNCAICHTGTYRTKNDEVPTVVPGAPAHTLNVQGLFRFLFAAAADPRFTASIILPEIKSEIELSWLDQQLYRFVIIPFTRRELQKQGRLLAWMDRPGVPEWGPGRDDAFNLPKYAVAQLPWDDSVGQCDFASVWSMKTRQGPDLLLNWGGETPAFHSVLVDSALGVGAQPGRELDRRLAELDEFFSNLAPPSYPFPIDQALAETGKPLYDAHCAECHEPGREKTNRIIPIEEIGTDRERFDTWTQAAADAFNREMDDMGYERAPVIKNDGYYSPPLDGLWMRAPYLHNGSVPNLRDILQPPAQRTEVFYRGYDVYDPANVGFVTDGAEAERVGWRHDTSVRGDGNEGHTYGTHLSGNEKAALLEYLKTL